jgi:hypothetical protein
LTEQEAEAARARRSGVCAGRGMDGLGGAGHNSDQEGYVRHGYCAAMGVFAAN